VTDYQLGWLERRTVRPFLLCPRSHKTQLKIVPDTVAQMFEFKRTYVPTRTHKAHIRITLWICIHGYMVCISNFSKVPRPSKGKKVNVKAVCGSYSTAALWHIVLLPERVPSFVSRDAAHTKRRERPLLAKEGIIS
jgi:hypothetical protein